MRNAPLIFSVALISIIVLSADALAQSGSRGMPRLPNAIQSRVGGARSKTIPSGGRPTGMVNSANALMRSGGQAGMSRGSGSRGAAGVSSSPRTPSLGGGGYLGRSSASTSEISRPPRRSSSSNKTAASTTASGSSTVGGASSPPAEGFRVWTDSTGRYSIQGKLAAQQDGMVWIRRTDGKLTKLPASKLSLADQRFLTGGS